MRDDGYATIDDAVELRWRLIMGRSPEVLLNMVSRYLPERKRKWPNCTDPSVLAIELASKVFSMPCQYAQVARVKSVGSFYP